MLKNAIRAALAAILTATGLVLESGKWVLRTLTNTHPLPVPVSEAEDAALVALDEDEADLLQLNADNKQSEAEWQVQHRFPVGVIAKTWLWSQADEWLDGAPDVSVLPAPAQAWLQGLTPEQRLHVKDYVHISDLQNHLTGKPVPSLPRVLTEAELLARAEQAAADRQATHDILQSLIDDEGDPPVRRAA